MDNGEAIINKVAQSGLVTLDPADFLPSSPITIFDLKDHLVQGLVLMEKPFREAIKNTDWSTYQGKMVGITCSTDALIPLWAYMLVSSQLQPFATKVLHGSEAEVKQQLLLENIQNIDLSLYLEAKVVVKGCGEVAIPAAAFVALTAKLRPVVRSLMYGEPCSTVPVYKNALTKI